MDLTEKPLITAKDFFWLLYLYPMAVLARIAPEGCIKAVGFLADPIIQILRRKQRRGVAQWMEIALPGLSQKKADMLAKRFISYKVSRVCDDLLLLNGRLPRECDVQIEGREHLDRALAEGRGALLLTGHFFANRIAKRYMEEIGYPVLSIRNHMPLDPLAGQLGSKWLQPRYTELLHRVIRDEVAIQDPECSLKVFRRLRSGGLVNIHIDSAFATNRLIRPFLGRKRYFAVGVLDVVRVSGCAVVPMLCTGKHQNLRIRFEQPLEIRRGLTRSKFVDTHLPMFIGVLESLIRSCPEEWELWALI